MYPQSGGRQKSKSGASSSLELVLRCCFDYNINNPVLLSPLQYGNGDWSLLTTAFYSESHIFAKFSIFEILASVVTCVTMWGVGCGTGAIIQPFIVAFCCSICIKYCKIDRMQQKMLKKTARELC
jgi:hypothetical protein